MVGKGVPQESSGRDEYEAPLGSSYSHATRKSKETSGEDQSEPPGGSSPPWTRPESVEVKDSPGEDESRTLVPGSISPRTTPRPGDIKDFLAGDGSKAPAPGSSSPRPPIQTTASKESSGSDQSSVPTPGASSPSPRASISNQLPLFGLVVGPDKSSSPPGRGRLINPKLGGIAAPNESQGTDKSNSERSGTSRGIPVVGSSFNILQSNDQQSHASPTANRTIVPPEEGSKEGAGPSEFQGIDKSKMKDTDESKPAKSGGITEESKAQDTEESKSESAFLDGLMGKEDTLAGVPVYISGSTDKRSAIILISDIYGFTPQLFRKVADKVAAAGYLAVIPDYFNGDPYKMVEGENPMSAFPDWLAKHPAAAVENVELTKKLIGFMKDNYGTTYVGLAGFGYGAKIAVTVGKDHDAKAIVQFNPSFVEPSDYEEVAVPIAVLAAPEDGVGKHLKILEHRSKKVKMIVNIYSGAVPGWPVRYDEKDKRAVRKASTAHTVMLKWFRGNM